MKCVLTSLITLTVILTSIPSPSLGQDDPNSPDYLIIDSSVSYLGGVGEVPLYFENDEDLSAIEVTINHTSPDIAIDSFSFAGGRLDAGTTTNGYAVDTSTGTIITIFSVASGVDLIGSGNGLLGTLHLSYSDTIMVQLIPIDTITWVVGPLHSHSTRFTWSDAPFDPFVPQSVSGYLDIQQSPATFDSLWMDTLDADPGEQIVLNVYAYNERDLAAIDVALDYGSTLLLFDSVSYDARSGASATSKTINRDSLNHTILTSLDFDFMPLAPSEGPLLGIHFTVDSSAQETVIPIDTTTVGISSSTQFTLTDADGGFSYPPMFTAGWIEIKITTSIEDITAENLLPAEYTLHQNYPNPFNPTTSIELSLPQAGYVTLEVFNILGQSVRRLVDQELPAGVHRVTFDGHNSRGKQLSSGIYFYRLKTDQHTESRKMILLK